MKELQLFTNHEFGEIRAIEIDGKPYFVGVDLARALDYPKPSQAVIDHCRGIRKTGIAHLQTNQHGYLGESIQETNVIPEGDVYRLIIKAADQSRSSDIKEKASRFERWLFDEVLPAIRHTGFYVDGQILTNNLKLLQQTVTELIDTRVKLENTEKERALLEVKLDESMEMWSIKRRCAALKIDYNWYLDKTGRNQGWRMLKSLSCAMGKHIQKVFDPNFPDGVNSYHIEVMNETERLFAEAG
ncbi:hypothetical protein FACS1894184_14820 [Clostridia bacterium]|nr:hypothetical protein FACS1894184_14820 [Clostridia bacterium]